MNNIPAPSSLKVTETGDGVVFGVHVQPRASRNELCGVQGDELKLRLTSPPVEDAANRLCIEFLAKQFGVAKSKVSIIAGSKSRHKVVRVEGITARLVCTLADQGTGTGKEPLRTK